MISSGLYYNPDSTMEPVQNYQNARFTQHPPVKLFHNPNLRRLDLSCDGLSLICRDGGTVFPSVVL